MPVRHIFLCVAALILIVLQPIAPAHAQSAVPAQVANLLQSEEGLAIEIRKQKAVLDAYYLEQQGPLLWIGTGRMPMLLQKLRSAETEGLFSNDYPTDYLQQLSDAVPQTDQQSQAVVELLYSAFFLKFASDMKAGRVLPRKVDPELYWQEKEIDLVDALNRLGASGTMENFIVGWEPSIPAYKALKAKLALYRQFAENNSWPKLPAGETLKPGMEDERVIVLRKRLEGDSPEGALAAKSDSPVYDETLEKAVKHFQRTHGLEHDGVIGFQTRVALNIPANERVRQIIVSMERWRWMPEDLGKDYILVNIAGFYLTRVENGRFVERKKVIVGKPYRRTPAFSDTIRYLEINPYWTVPYSIATRDKLPVLQKNPSALSASGFEVFAGSQQLEPRSISWSQYSASNFPFTLRQKPGPKNALGQVKFMFPNRFNVYLHDTPDRELFEKTFRSFSSGCVRVHQPIELAQALLEDQGWNRPRINAVLESGERTVVNLDKPLPIHIVYSTAWLAEDGTIRFSVDFYQRDEHLYQALFGKSVPWAGG